ncbi:MAG TPA: hypothetical protein ENK07_07070 [Bacteroidetes bacterium]|nr:hypothetical protein [Bacteroidota bacterium]
MEIVWIFVIGILAFAYTLEPLFRKSAAFSFASDRVTPSSVGTVLDVNVEEAKLDLALGKLAPVEFQTYVQEKATERADVEDALEREIRKLRRQKRGSKSGK